MMSLKTRASQLEREICARVHAQSCQTLGDRMDCSPPGSSVQGILQARRLKWVAISYARGIFQTQGLGLLRLLRHWQADSLPLLYLGNSKGD